MANRGPPRNQWQTPRESLLAAQRSLDSQKQVVIRAPTIMDIGQTFGSLLTMLQEVRRQVVAGNYVTIDLRHTSLISPQRCCWRPKSSVAIAIGQGASGEPFRGPKTSRQP